MFSFCCGHAQTLVALLIATAIIFVFDNWPGDIIKDYFTLECKSSTLIETGIIYAPVNGMPQYPPPAPSRGMVGD